MSARFSLPRLRALMIKEFIQILRDRSTFGMIFMMPIIQLLIYGYAINSNPKMLPTALVSADQSTYVRSITKALQNTGYFKIVTQSETEAEAEAKMARGEVQFIIQIPPDFSRDILRGEHPEMIVIADATDSVAVANALGSIGRINQNALTRDLQSAGENLQPRPLPFKIITHQRYNPEAITSYNIVPGLVGLLLNMTLVSLTAVAITRERERGTLENLLAMPVRPFEVMLGKIAPFIIIAYLQTMVILGMASILFRLPMEGSPLLLVVALGFYIVANLGIGFTFSTFAKSQMQAMQMSMFYFLPSMLLSGFFFPFRGMPGWAQALGEIFPITHINRILRGIVLKGVGWDAIWPDIWPMLIFMAFIGFVAMRRYRETLD
jgi:ABC-2 type transport system permease protein